MCTGLPVKVDGKLIFARTMEFAADMKSELRYTPDDIPLESALKKDENGPTHAGLSWDSQYSFMGPTAMGTDHLIEGFNEKGLHVAGFYFPGYATYQPWPTDPKAAKKCIGPINVVDFLLSTCENIDQAVTALENTPICDAYLDALGKVPPMHWIIQQSDGEAKVVEYIEGKCNILPNPLNVLTNSPDFTWQMTNIGNYANLTFNNAKPLKLTCGEIPPFGQGSGMLGLPGDFTPPSRFIRAVALSQSVALPGASSSPTTLDGGVNLAWNLINNVNIPIGAAREAEDEHNTHDAEDDYTQWVSVTDLTRKRYYYRTYDNQNIRVADMNDLAGHNEVKTISMNQPVVYQNVTG